MTKSHKLRNTFIQRRGTKLSNALYSAEVSNEQHIHVHRVRKQRVYGILDTSLANLNNFHNFWHA